MGCGKIIQAVPARHVLCLMLFLGFFMAFMLRVNLSVAIVVMVRPMNVSSQPDSRPVTSACGGSSGGNASSNVANDQILEEETEQSGEFEWDEVKQGWILGAFFWGYLFSQAPGGRVAELYGPRRVFGLSVFTNAVLCLLLPGLTRLHWWALLAVRALQGLAQGALFPSLSAAVATWCPIDERDRFISFAVQGATIGAVVSMPLCGAVGSWLGWDSIFYVTGSVALVWSVAWFLLVADSPQSHPRISERERVYLSKHVPPRTAESRSVPWWQALTSIQFLIGCMAAIGNDYGFHTLLTFAPKYMRSALGFDLQQNTLVASLPFLCQYVFALSYGAIMDRMLQRGWPLVRVRKLSTLFSHMIPAAGLILLSMIGCQVVLSVLVLTISVATVGAFTCGYFQNPLDVAPNFAGSLTGVMNMLGSMTGIVASPVAGLALHHHGSIDGWHTIFIIAAVTYAVTALPYLLLATSKVQPWNDEETKGASDGEAAVPMSQHVMTDVVAANEQPVKT